VLECAKPGKGSRLLLWESLMKKATKKLALAKETLRSLSLAESGKVAGGSVQCWSDPQYFCQNEVTPETYSSAC
jgi:hypothetical protein